MRKLFSGLAVFVAGLLLTACASTGDKGLGLTSAPAEPLSDGFSHDYIVTIYPGLDEKFDPNPQLTFQEKRQLTQLDIYCTGQLDRFSGMFAEMAKQAIGYGVLEGLLGSLAAKWAFGPAIKAVDYMAYIGGTAAGGGLMSGKITYDMARAVAHGYCMTGMVYKADELDHKLRRIFIVPVYTGKARLPGVSDRRAPDYRNEQQGGFIAPPPR